jgi:Zn-dependent metalloprotease
MDALLLMSPLSVQPGRMSGMPPTHLSPAAAPNGIHRCSILPTYLLRRLALDDDPHVADVAQRTIGFDTPWRERRIVVAERTQRKPRGLVPPDMVRRAKALDAGKRVQVTATLPAAPERSIHDANHSTFLPGELVRAEGAEPADDVAVNEAYDGLGATWSLLWTAYQRDSLDGKGLPLVATVHFDRGYDNAFWDGTQMVFGDGDGVYFDGFTSCIDVIGHELTHGLTQYTAGLTYVAQSGALNESVSDVFGILVKQMHEGETAETSDWLIGEGLFTDRVKGVALRSMKAPGTAYDDPVLGRDPQPAHMDDFEDLPHDAEHDNGGVHTNSGIPNRAFYLAASALGGYAWERAGQIWFDTITAKGVPKDIDFAGFAARTVAAASKRYGTTSEEVTAVEEAWATVGVELP